MRALLAFLGCVISAGPLLAAGAGERFVVAMCHDRAGNVWTGFEDDCLIRRDATTQNETRFTTRDGIGSDSIYAICADKLGRIWAGGTRGVSVYNGQRWQNYDILDGPIGERIYSLAANPITGDVLIATSAGLTVYSVDRDTWSHRTRDDGLPSDQIQSLAFDARGTLYAGTQCDGIAICEASNGRLAATRSPRSGALDEAAISDSASGYTHWRHVPGTDSVLLAPSGPGLPSNMINQVLVAPNGIVYVATPCGLAASKDSGKNFSFVRGADWTAKVKGLYGGAPKGWKPPPASFTLLEDYCSCLAIDEAGNLWIGHWRKGYEVVDPATLGRLYPSEPQPKKDAGGKKGAAPARPDYVYAILPRPGRSPLIGRYGEGVSEAEFTSPKPKHVAARVASAATGESRGEDETPLPRGSFGSGEGFAAAAGIAPLPRPAGVPTLEELNALLARLGTVPALKTLAPTVVELPDDWRTQGDWLGRYGRYWACLCAIESPDDYIWGAGPQPVAYSAYIGPNHPQKDDSLRYWVHWLATVNPRSLEMPPTYLDSRIKKGLTTPDKNRRQAEWDDHSEAYAPTLDGPHVYCTLKIPAGQFYLSLYDFNKDDHEGDNCLRDYRISIRPHSPGLSRGFAAEFERQPELARGRIHDFWRGVWKRYYVQGPIALTVQLNKNGSKNTILAGVMLDLLDERPPPYFLSLSEWQRQVSEFGDARKALLGESAAARAAHCKAQSDLAFAGSALFDQLERLRLLNAAWHASESERYYLALQRLYAAPGLFPDPVLVGRRLATCDYQLRMLPQWEELQRADRLTPARDVERAIRWDGYATTNSRFGYRNVLRYLKFGTVAGD